MGLRNCQSPGAGTPIAKYFHGFCSVCGVLSVEMGSFPRKVPLFAAPLEVFMWFKLFLGFRLPISILCLLAFGTLSFWAGFWGVALMVAALVYLFAVTAQLWRRRPGALHLAALLLA